MSRYAEFRLPWTLRSEAVQVLLVLLGSMASMALIVGTAQAQAQAQAQGQAASPNAASIRALQEKGKGAAAPKDAAVSAIAPRTFKRPLMRCRQEGRLIYEGSGMTVAASAASTPIELRSHSAVALQIFDLKSGLCLLDHTTD